MAKNINEKETLEPGAYFLRKVNGKNKLVAIKKNAPPIYSKGGEKPTLNGGEEFTMFG